MTGTPDITSRYDTKTELDFRNRLIAKFGIPRAKHFWSSGFDAMPKTALYPSGDDVKELCDEIPRRLPAPKETTAELGQFLFEWARLEERLLSRARQLTERNLSVRRGISELAQKGYLTKDLASTLDYIRRVRNTAAHSPAQVDPQEVAKALSALRELSGQIQREFG